MVLVGVNFRCCLIHDTLTGPRQLLQCGNSARLSQPPTDQANHKSMEFNYTQFYDPGIMASRFEMGGGSGDESPSSSQQCFQSEPLSRGASSHGSSQGSSTMTSPVFDSVQYASYALSQLSASPETESRLLLPTSPGASGSYSPDLERDMASPTRHPDYRHNRQ